MAVRSRESVFRGQLKQFELSDVTFTGEKLKGGAGSYGYVEVVSILGTRCAAKVIHSVFEDVEEGGEGKSPIDYFKEECTLMSKLRHPHIVQFLGICYPRGSVLPALVMELLMSCLHNYLEANERMKTAVPLTIKLNILLDVCKGLVYLHSKDIVHRDLTARNILLTESLTAKVADLGMARLLSLRAGRRAATMTKAPGNANYMPPEACDGNEYVAQYGKAIDSFSVGHLILFTITQKFLEPKKSTYYDKICNKPQARTEVERREDSFTAAHELIGEDHPLTRLAVRCLHDDPEKRPTALKIMQHVEQIPTVPYRIWRQSKSEFIYDTIQYENTVSELQQKNAKLSQDLSDRECLYHSVLKEKEKLVQGIKALQNEASSRKLKEGHATQAELLEEEVNCQNCGCMYVVNCLLAGRSIAH